MCFGMVMVKTQKGEYDIVPHDPAWTAEFAREAALLRTAFGNEAEAIEHVGATSVPGLSARPAIDIIVIVKDMEAARPGMRKLALFGYIDKGDHLENGSRFFSKMGIVNLHVVPQGHSFAAAQIGFRDYLRSHPDAVETCNAAPESLDERFAAYETAFAQAA